MGKRPKPHEWDTPLFEPPERVRPAKVRRDSLPDRQRLWTLDKATLISRYLYGFVMVTKSGTYIDAFAGPQWIRRPQSCAAVRALELEPPWLRHFHLFEVNEKKIPFLEALRARFHAGDRTVEIYPRDVNTTLPPLL